MRQSIKKSTAKSTTLPQSLAELAAEQVLLAHSQVASSALLSLWKNPDTKNEVTQLVLSQKRDRTLRKQSCVAIVLSRSPEPEGCTAMPLMVAADKLPEWLFLLLKFWGDQKHLCENGWHSPGGTNPKSEPWPRCGMGGLRLNLVVATLSCDLAEVWDKLLEHCGARNMCNRDPWWGGGPGLWDAFNLDANDQLEDEIAELRGQENADEDPLTLFADRACDILREQIVAAGEEFFEEGELDALAQETATINTQRAFLPAPFVTVTVQF